MREKILGKTTEELDADPDFLDHWLNKLGEESRVTTGSIRRNWEFIGQVTFEDGQKRLYRVNSRLYEEILNEKGEVTRFTLLEDLKDTLNKSRFLSASGRKDELNGTIWVMAEGTGELHEQMQHEVEASSLQLLGAIADVQDTLSMVIEKNKDVEEGERSAFLNAADALRAFTDAGPNLVTGNPRSIREEDRKKILPGQHAGVYLQFGLDDGSILKVNFWGGLRTFTTADLRDSDTSGKTSHTETTHRVISQPTQINWQVSFPGANGITIDSWIKYIPGGEEAFNQSNLTVNGEKIDAIPRFDAKSGYRFPETKEAIFAPIRKLTKLIRSSV